MSGPIALLLACAMFAAWARARHVYNRLADHSPTGHVSLADWVKALVSGDTDTEPDPDPAGYRLESKGSWTEVIWAKRRPAGPVPPAEPAPGPSPRRLDRWVAASVAKGARTRDIVEQGRRQFRVSESTLKRAIGRVRRGAP